MKTRLALHISQLRRIVLCALIACALPAAAGIPSGYYDKANGKSGEALKTALYGIISSHTNIGYDAVWKAFKSTDLRSDGKIWDIYSNITNFTYGTDQAGNYSAEGDCYNREHSFPQSWFKNTSRAGEMKADVFHLYPTDGYVNNRRSNYPFGEVSSASYSSANSFSKVGSSSVSGYSGTVFEPNDEYKGDLARSIFYMVTCYQNVISNCSGDMLSGDTYPSLTSWAKKMLLKWAKNDPVSEKEKARNEAIYSLQGNRNPYIDCPGLEQYVWGDSTSIAVDMKNYTGITSTDTGDDDDDDDDTPVTVSSTEFVKVTNASSLTAGDTLVIVYESGSLAMSTTQNDNNRGNASVTLSTSGSLSIVNVNDNVQLVVLEGSAGAWYLKAVNGSNTGYLCTSNNTSKNHLRTQASKDDYAKASISISGGDAIITFAGKSSRNVVQYNTSANLFACYNSSSQQAVQLYRRAASSTTGVGSVSRNGKKWFNVYTLDGRLARLGATTLKGLPRGTYVVNKKKITIK